MAIGAAKIGAATGGGSASSYTVPLPSGLVEGDEMRLSVSSQGSATHAAPTGWTSVAEVATGTTNTTTRFSVFRKRAVAGETAPTVTFPSGGTTSNAIIHAWSGVDATTPDDVAATTALNTSASTSHVAPALTTVTAGARYVTAPARGGGISTATPPTGHTKLGEAAKFGRSHTVGEEDRPTAGDTGTRTWVPDASLAYCAISMALRPAAEAGGETTAVTASDTGTGTESGSLTTTSTATDTGTGTESTAATASLDATDTATGTDSASLVISETKTASDFGTATDSASVTVALDAADTGAGTESASVVGDAAKSASDAGTATDTATVVVALSASDAGVGADSSGVFVLLLRADEALGNDVVLMSTVLAANDNGTGVDIATRVDDTVVIPGTLDAAARLAGAVATVTKAAQATTATTTSGTVTAWTSTTGATP